MDGQQSLRVGETVVVSIQLDHITCQGWRVRVVSRRQFGTFDDEGTSEYTHLNRDELADVLDAELERRLAAYTWAGRLSAAADEPAPLRGDH